jgi:DNA-binding winged helix-turn-helix (wHTH) protein/Tol biopolymer transport system component
MQYIFREFIVDSSLFLISKNGLKQEVEPRVFELLVYFCQHPNVPISRDELIEHVWQQRTVGYAAINRAVSELRKILENESSGPEIIKTISKVGYQFTIEPEIKNQSKDELETATPKATITVQNQVQPDLNVDKTSSNRKGKLTTTMLFFYVGLFLTLFSLMLFFVNSTQKTTALSNLSERPLTSLKGTAFRPVLSDDGKDLLFIHKNKAPSSAKVWLQHQNSPPLQLTQDDSYYTFAIFGANQQVIASRFNNLHQRKCEIVSIDLQSFIITPIFDCAERALTRLAYNSNRNILYFNFRSEVNSPFSIYAYQLSTTRLQQITFPYSDGNIRGDYTFSLSPSKNRLAVFEYQNNNTSLLKTISLSENQTEYHKPEFAVNSAISWLNNEQVVISDGKGIQTYHLTNKSTQRLIANTNIGFLSANTATGQIVFDKGMLIANIYQYSINNETTSQSVQPVTHSSFINYHPQFANLSKKSAYISTNGGDIAIMIKREGEQAYKAGFTKKIKGVANFHWSPDDNYLVASINGQLQLFNEKSKQWQKLAPENNKAHYVHFTNNENVLFSSDISGDWQIWRLHINSGRLTQLTETGGYSAQGNIDNGYLYLTKFNHAGLYRLNINTGDEETLIADFPLTSWRKWQVRANSIYYVREKGIYAFDTEKKVNRIVLKHNDRVPSSFSVSYDEQHIQREVVEESSANIWLIDTK